MRRKDAVQLAFVSVWLTEAFGVILHVLVLTVAALQVCPSPDLNSL